MALQRKLSSLDGVDETLHGLYVEKNGAYELDVEPEDRSAFNKRLQEAEAARQEAERRAEEQGEELGSLRSELENAQKAIAARKRKKPDNEPPHVDEEEVERRVKAAEESYMKKLAKVEETASRRDQIAKNSFKESAAVRAISALGGEPELLLPHVMQRLDVQEEEGKFNVRVKSAGGDSFEISQARSDGSYMGVEELVSQLKEHETFGRAFKGTVASGSGTQPGASNGKPIGVRSRAELKDPKKAAEFISAHGSAAYLSLPMS